MWTSGDVLNSARELSGAVIAVLASESLSWHQEDPGRPIERDMISAVSIWADFPVDRRADRVLYLSALKRLTY